MSIVDTARRTLSEGVRQATRAGGWAAGKGVEAFRGSDRQPGPDPQRSNHPKDLSDGDITNKVRSTVFRGLRGVDKGKVDINTVDGVVWLRGEVKSPHHVRSLEERTRAVPEVREVQNLLHIPKTPSPSRTDTPGPQRKTRSKSTPPAKPRTQPRRINADKTEAQTRDAPTTLAGEGKGRRPADFGSEGTGTRS